MAQEQEQEQGASTSPTESGFWDNFEGVTSLATGGLKIATQIFGYQEAKARAQIQTAERQRQYWTQWAQTNRENYRQYEYQLRSWYRSSDYVNKFRQYQTDLQKQAATFKGEVSTAATENFARQLVDLEGRFYEEEARDEMQINTLMIDKFVKENKKAATGQVGRTVTRLNNQYNQRYLGNISNRQITRKFRIADKQSAAQALTVARENTVNSAKFYTPQPIADPIKPMAPAKITAIEPAKVQGPSGSALALSIGEIGIDTLMDYKNSLPEASDDSSSSDSPD